MPSDKKPYVGPQPFKIEDEKFFFGREIETSELFSLTISHPVLVLYAQSGAGKSSLVNAGLIPRFLKEQFSVLPVARVGLSLSESPECSNIYVYNAISGWKDATSPDDHFKTSLLGYLGVKETPRLLIFDQFEEIFTVSPGHWKHIEGFFRQLGEALKEDPNIRTLLVIREDFIAQLEPYGHFLPEQLQNRFRLERLKEGPALEAVVKPALAHGVEFSPGAAEKVIRDLLTIRFDDMHGKIREVAGEYVDPLQLQLTCLSLWKKLPPDTKLITDELIKQYTDVDAILGEFYEETIHTVATRYLISEEELRSFFNDSLITKLGTRGTVYRDKDKTAGISNKAIDELGESHLIYAQIRSGAKWYELTHDRFIKPILKANSDYTVRLSAAYRQLLEEQLSQDSSNKSKIGEDRYQPLIDQLNEMKASPEGKVMTLFRIGQMMKKSGRNDEAIEVLSRALVIEPTSALVYLERGEAYWYKGDLNSAYQDFSKIIELIGDENPGYIHYLVFHNRGQVLAELNRNLDAIEDLRTAIRIENEIGEEPGYARNGLALALGNAGNYKESMEQFTMAIAEHPKNAWVYFNRASIFEKMGQIDRALADYVLSLKLKDPPLSIHKMQIAQKKVAEFSGKG